MQGQIFVLEQGTREIQAFDTSGNPLPCFDPTGSGTKQATMPLAKATDHTVWLDVAVELGYLYVLSYEGVGASPDDYHLDLYRPDGSFLARTNEFAAAAIAVDIIRDVYSLNYEVLDAAAGPEPSIQPVGATGEVVPGAAFSASTAPHWCCRGHRRPSSRSARAATP